MLSEWRSGKKYEGHFFKYLSQNLVTQGATHYKLK